MRAESTRLIWPGTDTRSLAILCIDHRVGLHVFGDFEGELHVFEFGRRRRRAW